MFRLITFGSLALLHDGAPHEGPAGQRRCLVLLALLAAAGRRGVPRDRVLALLWPDAGPDAARHALNQVTHLLRRAAGADAVRGTATLALDATLVASDVAEFDAAVERGALETAARLYGGPFLDGADAAAGRDEFARWCAAARERRARDYAAALARLAADARGRRDAVAAVHWSRRLAAAEPLDARAACGLVEALVAAGDGSGALQAALVHERLVRAELDAAPDASVRAWIARLRAETAAVAGDSLGVPGEGGIGIPRDAVSRALPPRAADAAGPSDRPPWHEFVRSRLQARYALDAVRSDGPTLTTFDARDRGRTQAVRVHVLAPRRGGADARAGDALRVLERVAALHEPRVERVLDCGVADGVVYYATAPEVGTTLRDRLGAGRGLALGEAVRVGAEICDALAAAESAGVAHGDLRPKHVRLGPDGVTLAALGVIQAAAAMRPADDASTAVTVGAPAYLSPEQIAGEVVADARGDVYALGCVLFEMLAGDPPFGRGSALGVLTRKLHERPPSVRACRAGVPAALDDLVARALAPVPADRPRSAAELRDALRRVAAGVGP